MRSSFIKRRCAAIAVDQNPEKRQEMIDKSGRQTVPQIFIGEHHVGGFDDLYELEVIRCPRRLFELH